MEKGKYYFFDLYREIALETIDILQDPVNERRLARAQEMDALREMLTLDPHYLDRVRPVPQGMRYILNQLNQTKPYVLTHDVVQMVLDISNRAGNTAVPYTPFIKFPFWIEFEGIAVGDDLIRFVAVWVTREPGLRNIVCVRLLCDDMQQSKDLFFNLETGMWEYEQMGACSTAHCQLARYTREGKPYRLTQQDSQEWAKKGCNCAIGGRTWSQLTNILNQVLTYQQEPLHEEVIVRAVPVPHPNPQTRAQKIANSTARSKSRANIVIVSLTAPVRVVQQSTPSSAEHKSQGTMTMEKVEVEGSWRALIPGEGKPWKTLHVFYVDEYSRRKPTRH